ncbi:ABC-2 type transport system permease protein [Nonomuraea thailandensis]|uniref:ABC-2 type transport system permease protein n=1 Tax=Nonomuraea thailandensis TaxID=1188745 RepID=A0A9X2K639_9ACTN|nr:ABC transporter permease [Nonomuraea thailandensis]MCP2361748.1 ABC-2 type transport system permease protein [Nonomuraea thailandensis]
MRRELHAEWTKLRTVPGPVRLLIGIVALTVAGSAAAAGAMECPSAGCGQDAARVGLFGVQLGQGLVALLAVVAVCGEYSTGMVRTSLTAMPRRMTALAARTALLAGLTSAAGALGVLGSLLVARLLLPGNGFTPEHGYPPLSLADGPTLRAAAGSVLYLVLIAVLSAGVATAVRDSAVSAGAVLGLIYLFPMVVLMIRNEDVQRLLWRLSPMNAGLAVQATTTLPAMPIGAWAGLGVAAAWAGAALVCGGLLLRARDA